MQTLPVTTLCNSDALLPVPLSWYQGLPEGTAGWQVGPSRAFRRVFPEPLQGCVCLGGKEGRLDGGPAAGRLGEPEF